MAVLEAGTLGDTHAAEGTSLEIAASCQWLEVVPHLDPVYGGLCAVVPRLAAELAQRAGTQTHVAAFCSPGEDRLAAGLQNTSTWPLSHSAWLKDAKLRRAFRSRVVRSAGVHVHGLWESSTWMAASTARQNGKPYVLSAHGMLERWALANKRLKKQLYAAAVEHRNVREATCLHALTTAEAEDYRRFGCKGPIAVIPNGVEARRDAEPAVFLSRFPQLVGKQLILFLGRIHFKKGVDLLVESWSQLASSFPDAMLVLAGPDSEGTLPRIQAAVEQKGLQHRVVFTGMLDPVSKWSALAAARCFVLPSYSEGLSVAALEALGMGVPAIVSRECNLPEVQQAEAGWLIETSVDSLTAALRVALLASDEEWQRISGRAAALAAQQFSWSSVGARMAAVYRWASGGPEPDSVEILERQT